MRKTIIPSIAAVLCITGGTALGDGRRPVALPAGYFPGSEPSQAAFASAGTVGFVAALNSRDFTWRLFSFSTTTGQIEDSSDLTPDFGAGPSGASLILSLKAHDATGLLAVYGRDSNAVQKVVMFNSDPQGHLSRLWGLAFAAVTAPQFSPPVAFNSDGSRLYVIDYSVTSQIAYKINLIRTFDGSIVDQLTLGGTVFTQGFVFDAQSDRVLALIDASVFAFASDPDHLTVVSKVGPVTDSNKLVKATQLIGVQDGHLVLTYAGFVGNLSGDGRGSANVFLLTDINSGMSSTLSLEELLVPFSFTTALLDPVTNSVLVPYAGKSPDCLDIIRVTMPTSQSGILSVDASGLTLLALSWRAPEC